MENKRMTISKEEWEGLNTRLKNAEADRDALLGLVDKINWDLACCVHWNGDEKAAKACGIHRTNCVDCHVAWLSKQRAV